MFISDSRFFTIMLASLSLIVMTVSTLFFPGFLVQEADPDEIALSGIADYWEDHDVILPVITNLAIAFAKAKWARRIGLLVFVLVTAFVEVFVKERKVAGGFHGITLVLGITFSWFLLMAVFMPFMPL